MNALHSTIIAAEGEKLKGFMITITSALLYTHSPLTVVTPLLSAVGLQMHMVYSEFMLWMLLYNNFNFHA